MLHASHPRTHQSDEENCRVAVVERPVFHKQGPSIMGDITFEIIFIIVLLIANGIFSMSEMTDTATQTTARRRGRRVSNAGRLPDDAPRPRSHGHRSSGIRWLAL